MTGYRLIPMRFQFTKAKRLRLATKNVAGNKISAGTNASQLMHRDNPQINSTNNKQQHQ